MAHQVHSPAHYAAEAARLTKADQCDSRAFDDCFEMGHGAHVVAAFVALYQKDAQLRAAVERNDQYIGIEKWQQTAANVYDQLHYPLFAQ